MNFPAEGFSRDI